MLNAAFVGWLIGKAIVGLVRGVIWVIRSAAYLAGAAGGWAARSERPSFRKGSPF